MSKLEKAEKAYSKSVQRYVDALAALKRAIEYQESDAVIVKRAHELAGSDWEIMRTRKSLHKASTISAEATPDYRDLHG